MATVAPLLLTPEFPERASRFPMIRFMGSKHRLLPWLYEILSGLDFQTSLDAFSGSGCVGYLLKNMGKSVTTNDALHFSSVITRAVIENSTCTVDADETAMLVRNNPRQRHFIERTFTDVFFSPEDLRFLDRVWSNLRTLNNPHKEALAIAAMVRACAKRQPRGVFTVAGDPAHYKDGRRDLRLSLQEHFLEHIAAYNEAVFDNHQAHRTLEGDVFSINPQGFDLVYMDPPYVPRADDNCYIKRYHFLEGLSRYWEGVEILATSKVKKLRKPFTPFSYRKTALDAFDRLFAHFASSILVVSYSSNGYPDLNVLLEVMGRYKSDIVVHERSHRYHFGTHQHAVRNDVTEYLIVGR